MSSILNEGCVFDTEQATEKKKNKPFRIGHYSNIFKCIASARILSIN